MCELLNLQNAYVVRIAFMEYQKKLGVDESLREINWQLFREILKNEIRADNEKDRIYKKGE